MSVSCTLTILLKYLSNRMSVAEEKKMELVTWKEN